MKLSEFADARQIQTRDTVRTVVEVLREAIVSGLFKPGSPLRQDTIATELGTSKIPVREALRQLEAEGLVRFVTNKGAIVAPMSLLEMTELFELRSLLECEAIALAMPHLTSPSLEQARQILEEAEVESNVAHWGELNWRFHAALCSPAQRPYLLSILEKLHIHCDRYVRLYLSLTNSQPRSQAEHRALLRACKKGNVAIAQQLLQEHLALAQQLLAQHLKDCFQKPL